VAVILHGFGDDAFGSAPRLLDLPDLDAVVFTFRGRDMDPTIPVALGAWERKDVDAVVGYLVGHGIHRDRILLVGASQGAGVALLALEDLERTGSALGGALLESPFLDLRDATRNHLRGTLGRAEILARPAESVALWRAGRVARFDPDSVSPLRASRDLRTPMAFITGDADVVTPLAGVEAIAHRHPDLTVVTGAGHLEAGERFPGGWKAWAEPRLIRWGF
jgi:pimeloyl-ACP methyl ester carboxylesterase